MSEVRIMTLISGKVQGVGFRYWTREEARALGITGFVRNLSDGRVEALFEGDTKSVERMLDLLKMGPPHARVQDIEVDRDEYLGQYRSFDIER